MESTFSCFVIGDGLLTLRCADILRNGGQEVLGIITSNQEVASWTLANRLRHVDHSAHLITVLEERPFDYLFSIVNMRLLPREIVRLPRRGVINFHDGPLPRYAGIHATSWALINGERKHAVTWHFVNETVDGGQILKQEQFDIVESETAYSLNLKCFGAGAQTFPEVVRELAAGATRFGEQDLAQRSYYGRFQRPAAACVVSWEQTAADTARFIRALEFGPVANPMGRAKVYLNGEFFLCPEAKVRETPDASQPGTILDAGVGPLRVATAQGAIEIQQLLTLDGKPAPLSEVVERCHLRTGSVLSGWDGVRATLATELNNDVCHHESFWVERLQDLQPVAMPYLDPVAISVRPTKQATLEMAVPDKVLSFLRVQRPSWNPAEFLLAAFAAYLSRISDEPRFDLGVSLPTLDRELAGAKGLFSPVVPLPVEIDAGSDFDAQYASLHAQLELTRRHKTFLHDVLARYPELRSIASQGLQKCLRVHVNLVDILDDQCPDAGAELRLVVPSRADRCRWIFPSTVLCESRARLMIGQFTTFLLGFAADSGIAVGLIPIISEAESHRMLETWNATDAGLPAGDSLHSFIERQVLDTPDAVAVVCRDHQVSYRELNSRANQLAGHLRKLGVERETLVGIAVNRSIEMVVGLLGILKAGGAYVPLDPTYPQHRIAFMLEDSKAAVLVTEQSLLSSLPDYRAKTVCLDTDWPEIAQEGADNVSSHIQPQNLAYVIYTSGSTGPPKGVMVEHQNVMNFFVGMDQRIGRDPGVWLAVTSVSFDISVLELFWTLARGFKVVLVTDDDRLAMPVPRRLHPSRSMDFSLFYFASEVGGDALGRYRLLIESAKFGDENGFAAVWTPERHFHSFGGLYSNPSVTSAALAAVTRRIGIRAGSVVAPLHHPVRLAEEWALVDNLSGGRVGVSFASGWQANDFIFAPERYTDRKQIMLDDVAKVRRLWRGETILFRGGDGREVPVKIYPMPIQADLPVWVTAAGNPETFRQAGEIGANVLTHLLGQKIEDVERKIRIYREARIGAGFQGRGQATLMLHTYVGPTMEAVKAAVRDPMYKYLRTSVDLIRNAPFAFPTFKLPKESVAEKVKQGLNSFSSEDMEALLEFAFERYFETSGLFGTIDRCLETVDRCKGADVDEIACLIDFGVPVEQTLEGLYALNEVRVRSNHAVSAPVQSKDYSLLSQIKTHGVTHLQCTPSLGRALADQRGGIEILAGLQRLMLGGETLPPDLVSRLRPIVRGEIHNMYGPTETTVWSTTDRLSPGEDFVTIGQPIANTQVYVVDRQLGLLPPGIPGELLIGGKGVARGYLNREDLTRDRFVPNPFPGREDSRLYRTGDLVAWRSDGRLDFLGRLDNQVKIRGYRIELGEVEHAVTAHATVSRAVVTCRFRTNGEAELVAFYLTHSGRSVESQEFRDFLSTKLPDYMIPASFVQLDELPMTPNGKVDRKVLGAMPVATETLRRLPDAIPSTEFEKRIASVISEVLELNRIGVEENFFNLGANSLTLVRVASRLGEMFPGRVGLVDLFQHTTIRSLAKFLLNSNVERKRSANWGGDRGRQRREALLARRNVNRRG
jgi:natural product biosynthesis luciferase-like monooxygenase protein